MGLQRQQLGNLCPLPANEPCTILSVLILDSIRYPWISPPQAQGWSLAERVSLTPLEGL